MSIPDNPDLPVEDAKGRLRAAGLRCTASRIAVLQCLSRCSAPAPAPDISTALHDYGFDKSTIYRNLGELSDAGLVTRLDLGDSMRRYELTDKNANGPVHHPHFVCGECGKVQCLDGYQFRLAPERGAAPLPGEIDEVLVRGRCRECAKH